MASQPTIPPLSPPLRVVLADNSVIARDSLRSMLEDLPGIVLLGEACSGPGTISLCLQQHPDLALVDIRMPGMDGIAVTRALAHAVPDLRVIIITIMSEPALIAEALRAGARGYLLKDLSHDELVAALSKVAEGELYISAELAAWGG